MGVKEEMKKFNEDKPTIDIKFDRQEDGLSIEINSNNVGKKEVFGVCSSLLNGLAEANDIHFVEILREMTIMMMARDLSSRGDK